MEATQPLMFPAEIDRFRLFEHIIDWKIKTFRKKDGTIGITQTDLVRRTNIKNQETASHLTHLSKAACDPPGTKLSESKAKRRPGRQTCVQIMTWGLELPLITVDALLWLYGQPPLDHEEIRHYVTSYTRKGIGPKTFTSQQLRTHVLHLLRGALNHSFRSSASRLGEVQLFSQDESVEGETVLRYMESEPGVQLLVTEYPSLIFLSEKFAMEKYQRLQRLGHISESQKAELIDCHKTRRIQFIHTIETYGVQAMFCRPSLVAFFQRHASATDIKTAMRSEIQQCIEFLEYPYFEVGLAKSTPELEFDIKSCSKVMSQAATGYEIENDLRRPSWGPYYIQWLDKRSTLSFFLDFQEAWVKIPAKDREKSRVKNWLQSLLHRYCS